jgi:SAM-dependent methyltransferase
MSRLAARAAFDRVAGLYDRVRPGYPAALFDQVAAPGRRVLEIGCGTGQASVGLAARGCVLLAVELGPHLAELARRRLAAYPDARVVVADFDTWAPDDDEDEFDLVFSSTAYHWLDPVTRDARSAGLLRRDGVLATVATHHVAGGTQRFFTDVQACYRRYDPRTTGDAPGPADRVPYATNLDRTRYRRPVFHRWEWDVEYTTRDYLDVLRTYSSTLTMPPIAAEAMLRAIGELIDARYGGRITKRYLTELRTAERR